MIAAQVLIARAAATVVTNTTILPTRQSRLPSRHLSQYHVIWNPTYVQLSRCPSLDGITLLSEARESDFIGNKVPDNMIAAEERLERLSDKTVSEAESWDW